MFLTHVRNFRGHFFSILELDGYDERVAEVHRLVDLLPEPNKRMLELLLRHLVC